MLRARLLGALEVELNGAVINPSPSQRPWTLFAYLALASRAVPRAELASRFWPDVLDQSARASLRSALWALRRQLGDSLAVDGDRVKLRDPEGVWVDVREFDRLAGEDADAALALCRGELLEGIEDDWAIAARERHRTRVTALFEELARAAEQHDEPREAIGLTRRQVGNDPFDEEAHRRLMIRQHASGDRAGAILTYRTLSDRLRRELGVAPSSQTRELIEQLRDPPPAPPPAPGSPPSGLLPLVGRDRELAELERAWRAVGAGPGTVAIVTGEAGIGKTRLATELRTRADASGAQTAVCAALDLGGTAPLSLWAELIRELVGPMNAPPPEAAWPEDLAALAVELPAHFARTGAARTTVSPDLQRTRLFEAVVAMLAWAARQTPLLLVLEDIHSADEPSLELAGYAARRLAGLSVMMVITRRELPHSTAADRLEQALRARALVGCEIELAALPAPQTAALARAAAPLGERDVKRVVDRAEGNPLLAVETARALGRGRDGIAASLRGSVRATLGPLSGDVRKLVEIAAVAARALHAAELLALPLADTGETATEALETGLLLSANGMIGFRHALLREAVYEEIAEPRRRGLHQRWANVLLEREATGGIPRPAEAARHLRLAGADTDAVPQLARAAADARAVAALEQAVAYLHEALEIAPDRTELWLELGELEAWRGRRDQAEVAFERASALVAQAEPLERARAWLRQARTYHGAICIPRRVLESTRNALEQLKLTEQPAREERSECLAASAWAEAVSGSVEQAERLLAELSTLAPPRDELSIYDTGHARALALMRRGRFVESYGPSIAAGEAIANAGRPDLAYGCWANAAGAAMAAGERERALEFIDRGMAVVAGHGLTSLEIHLAGARSFVLGRLGKLTDARQAAQIERALAEELGAPELVAMAGHDLGLVALEARDYESAVVLLTDSLVAGAPISRPLTRLALAEALARSGDVQRAAQEVRATVLEPVSPGDFPDSLVPRLARVQGLIAIAKGDRDEALRRLQEAFAGWERLLARSIRAESITTALSDLGRPVVGLVEPERELERVHADLAAVRTGGPNAVIS